LKQLLVEHLRRSGQYKSVQRISSTARGDYLLRGHLTSLNERDDPAGIKRASMFNLNYSIRRPASLCGRTVIPTMSRSKKKRVSAVVRRCKKCEYRISQLTGSLAQYFASLPAK